MNRLLSLLAICCTIFLTAACGNVNDINDNESDEEALEENNAEEPSESPSAEDERPVSDEEESHEVDLEENMTDGEEETKTFTIEQDDTVNTLEFTYIDDEVTIQTSETEISYENLDVADEDEARELLEEAYEDIEGVEQNIEYEEEGMHEIIEVDYENGDIEELANLQGMQFQGNAEEAEYISMTQTEEQVLNSGYEME